MTSRFRFLAIALAFMTPTIATAMEQNQTPAKFNIPWGSSAVAPYTRTIPQASQIGIQNCAASLTDGFPPLTFIPATGGGCPPYGADFNGILKQITQWSRWGQAGGPIFFDSGFSSQIGGYPKGATLQSAVLSGRIWYSTADDNTTDPDSTIAANWIALPGTTPAGTPVASLSTTIPPNMVSANGLTVGNASSNATSRHNADTYWLFGFLWTNCPTCQLFNSAGFSIARGANSNADYAANNAIATVNMNGATLMGADSQNGTTSSNLLNVPVASGSRTVPTSLLGENLHSLIAAENGPHIHSVFLNDPGHNHVMTNGSGTAQFVYAGGGGQGGVTQQLVTSTNTTGITVRDTSGGGGTANQTASQGSGTGHNTVPRSIVTYWNLAL